jgi:hypothetical protein
LLLLLPLGFRWLIVVARVLLWKDDCCRDKDRSDMFEA